MNPIHEPTSAVHHTLIAALLCVAMGYNTSFWDVPHLGHSLKTCR